MSKVNIAVFVSVPPVLGRVSSTIQRLRGCFLTRFFAS